MICCKVSISSVKLVHRLGAAGAPPLPAHLRVRAKPLCRTFVFLNTSLFSSYSDFFFSYEIIQIKLD